MLKNLKSKTYVVMLLSKITARCLVLFWAYDRISVSILLDIVKIEFCITLHSLILRGRTKSFIDDGLSKPR